MRPQLSRRGPDARPGSEHPEGRLVRSALLLEIGAVAALVALFVAGALWFHSAAINQALDDVVGRTQRLAEQTVAPFVDNGVLTGDPESMAMLERVITARMGDETIMRIKVWDETGRIVYSDEERLIGRTFELPDEAVGILAGGPAVARYEKPFGPENLYETSPENVVEVYTSAPSAAGPTLIFEAYYSADALRPNQHSMLMTLIPAAVIALLLVLALQLIPIVDLSKRIRNFAGFRRRVLREAMTASDLDRQRIAQDLHDNVVQDLAGLSYALESIEARTAEDVRPLIAQGRTILQGDVDTIRALLRELDPADVEGLGLEGVFRRFVEPLRRQGVQLRLEIRDDPALDPILARVLYRAAQQLLLKDYGRGGPPRSMTLRLFREGNTARMDVLDESAAGRPMQRAEDQAGVRAARSAVAGADGYVEVRTVPGEGTMVSVVVPLE